MIERLVDPGSSGPRRQPPERERQPRAAKGFFALRNLLRIFGVLFGLGVLTTAVLAAFAVAYVVRVTEDLPEIADLADYEPPVMSRVHAGDGRLIAEYARESRVFVPIETIPPQILHAFLSAEDKTFYEHNGLYFEGMFRAGLRNVINRLRGIGGPLQGGSTITQQVAKNFKLDASQNIARKVREMVLARRIEQAFTKDEILELYLNEIYLGRRAYGVAAAALLYFAKPLDELTLSEVAYLAAVPRAPNNYHPVRNKDRAISRRNWVLDRMVANGYIDEAEAEIAKRDDLIVADRLTGSTYLAAEYFVEEVRRLVFSMYGEEELYDGGLSIRTTLDTRLQIAARNALRSGLEAYDRRYGYRGPLATIEIGEGWEERLIEVEPHPDLDPDWAKAVVLSSGAASANIGFLDGSTGQIPLSELTWARRRGDNGRGPEISQASAALAVGDVIYAAPLGPDPETRADRSGQFGLRQVPAANGAIMAIDPHTGRVLALVGGYSFRLSQFNRATQARRQPGSSFKPFVYAAALDNGYTPVSRVLDAPYVSTGGIDGTFYKPSNYSARWYGLSTLRLGVELSRNAMTVRLANAVGLDIMSEYGERFGIYDDLPAYESMALGAGETTLWRMVRAYAELVNGGKEIMPTILDRVQDRNGVTIFRHDARECTDCNVLEELDWVEAPAPTLSDPRATVVDPVTAYQVVSILEGVVVRGTARRSVGTLPWPLAGKTGTTNDFKDAWFVGFSPDLVAGVYMGYDTPRPLGDGESGGRVAAPVFRDFMEAALADAPLTPFRTPPGVRILPVNGRTGALARFGDPGTINEAFRPGTEPTSFDSDDGAFSSSRGGVRVAGPYEAVESTRNYSEFDYEDAATVDPATGEAGVSGEPVAGGLDALLSHLENAEHPEDGLPVEADDEEEDEDLGGLY